MAKKHLLSHHSLNCHFRLRQKGPLKGENNGIQNKAEGVPQCAARTANQYAPMQCHHKCISL